MNRNYTVFVFRHIKAHPWHKVCEIYLSHYTHPALHFCLNLGILLPVPAVHDRPAAEAHGDSRSGQPVRLQPPHSE